MSLDPIHDEALRRYAKEFDVDPELAIAVGTHESGAKGAAAVSQKGARGVMQVMPATTKALAPKYGPDRRRQGVGYLKELGDKFASLAYPEQRNFTLAAYNAGPTKVAKARAKARKLGFDDTKFDNVKRFLPRETQKYVPGVLGRIPKLVAPLPLAIKPPVASAEAIQAAKPLMPLSSRPQGLFRVASTKPREVRAN